MKNLANRRVRIVNIMRENQPVESASKSSTDWSGVFNKLSIFSTPDPSAVIKNSAVADLLEMTPKDIASHARTLDVAGMLAQIESLAEELRRLNNFVADQDGVTPNEANSLTAGEARVEGLRKSLGIPGAAANVNVLAAQREIEARLEAIIDVHEERQRRASVNDGELKSDRPGNGMTLDQVSKYADRENEIAQQLRDYTDPGNSASVLGLSRQSLESAKQIQKNRSAYLPSDSFSASNVDLAEQLQKSQTEQIGMHWSQRSRR